MATVITNVTELQAMENDLTADYELGNDIDASATSGWNDGDGFDPIGSPYTPFTGSFDGKGYTIDSLYIDRVTTSDCGLFGYLGDNVIIGKVSLTDVDIVGKDRTGALIGQTGDSCTITSCSSGGAHLYGGRQTGGLIGALGSSCTVSKCYSTCTISGGGNGTGGLIGTANPSVIESCYAFGAITHRSSFYPRAGGLIGFSYATVRRCFATGNIGGYDQLGGFIGRNDGTIENCYAKGDVTGDDIVGGFCGYNNGDIDNAYSTGVPTGNTEVGGFCGGNNDTITDCFWDILTSETIISDGGTGKSTTSMKTQSTFEDAGWDFPHMWYLTTRRNDGYPILSFGYIWTGGDKLRFTSEANFTSKAKPQMILGTDTGTNAVAGHHSVEGNYLHYISENGDERRRVGKNTGVDASAGSEGQIWIDDLWIFYVDSSLNIRKLGTWILGGSRLGVDTILHA